MKQASAYQSGMQKSGGGGLFLGKAMSPLLAFQYR